MPQVCPPLLLLLVLVQYTHVQAALPALSHAKHWLLFNFPPGCGREERPQLLSVDPLRGQTPLSVVPTLQPFMQGSQPPVVHVRVVVGKLPLSASPQ